MAFGAELKDFVSGFKTGRDIVTDSEDRADKRKAREEDKKWAEENRDYQHGRDKVADDRYATGLARQNERWARQDAQQDDANARAWAEYKTRAKHYQDLIDAGKDPDGSIAAMRDSDTPPPALPAIDDGEDATPGVDPATTNSISGPQSSVIYDNHGVRNEPLSKPLETAFNTIGPQLGVKVKVFSGGQESNAPGVGTGSTRHNHGNAADIFLYDAKTGRKLDWANPQDAPVFEKFVAAGKRAGLTGFGAGKGYMQPGSMHAGYGNPGVWGAGGKGANAADWLRTAYNGNFSKGGLVENFALGGPVGVAIDDGQQEDPMAGLLSVSIGDPQQEAQAQPQEAPQEVAEAIPSNVPTPTPKPAYEGEGVTDKEEPTDDLHENARRAVRDGIKRALKDNGVGDDGAIDDPQSDQAHIGYLKGKGAADGQLVREAMKAVDPDKKMTPGERNMAAFGHVYKFYTDRGQPEKATEAAKSMVQYYRQEFNRYASLAQAAASNGHLDEAGKAAVAAYTNVPNGRDMKITKHKKGYEIQVTDADGSVVTKKVLDPQEFGAAFTGFTPAAFDEEILNAAGVAPAKRTDVKPDKLAEIESNIKQSLTDNPEITANLNPEQISGIQDVAAGIARLGTMGEDEATRFAAGLVSMDKDNPDSTKKNYTVKNDRGNPDYVVVTSQGKSVPMSRNTLASLEGTASAGVKVRESQISGRKKQADDEAKTIADKKRASEELHKAIGGSDGAVADRDAGTFTGLPTGPTEAIPGGIEGGTGDKPIDAGQAIPAGEGNIADEGTRDAINKLVAQRDALMKAPDQQRAAPVLQQINDALKRLGYTGQ